MIDRWGWIGGAAIAGIAAHAVAAIPQTPRELLVEAAFNDRDKGIALARIDRAGAGARAILSQKPDDQDAALVQATALGYRAKLTGDRSGAIASRRQFESLTVRFPRNPETWVALGAWHFGVINKYGRIAGRMAAGAQKGVGLAALDRAVVLGGNRALFVGLSGLLRIELDPSDAEGLRLTETASHSATPTQLDRYIQRAAVAVLVPLKAGDRKTAQTLADRLLPLGQIS